MKTEQDSKPAMETDLTYKIKCRLCGKITEMWFAKRDQIDKKDFLIWMREHATFPIEKQCGCDNGSIMLHDLVAYTIV